jgi:hypothetical protein
MVDSRSWACSSRHQGLGIGVGKWVVDNVQLDLCWNFFVFDLHFVAFYRVIGVTLDIEWKNHIITSDLCEL